MSRQFLFAGGFLFTGLLALCVLSVSINRAASPNIFLVLRGKVYLAYVQSISTTGAFTDSKWLFMATSAGEQIMLEMDDAFRFHRDLTNYVEQTVSVLGQFERFDPPRSSPFGDLQGKLITVRIR